CPPPRCPACERRSRAAASRRRGRRPPPRSRCRAGVALARRAAGPGPRRSLPAWHLRSHHGGTARGPRDTPRAVERLDAAPEPAEPAAVRVGATDAVVGHLHGENVAV